MSVLETERLVLRAPESRDAQAIADALGDSKSTVVPHPFTLLDAEAFVADRIAKRAMGEAYSFAIVRKQTGRVLGIATLSLSRGAYKLSFWLARQHWHQGYASEAAKKVLAFAFHDLRAERVQATWFADNPAAGRVLEKLGFEPVEAYRREDLARGGFTICNRCVLRRESFGRKRARLDHPNLFAEAVGA